MAPQFMAANLIQSMSLNGHHTPDYLSDDESLFGSPPPSPGTGKACSLALPSEGLDSEQNVGTLALPGSHNPSKLPVDSVVYLLDACHRPLDAPPWAFTPTQTMAGYPTLLTPTVNDSDAASRPSRSTTDRVSKKRKSAKKPPKTPSIATPGPSIELPPSNAPVPPNFLRNQQALLGIAGLVAKINPASLSTHRRNQGDNPRNPIVVEDQGATFHLSEQPAAPTPAQLLTTLSAQKDLFPVLQQLLDILRRGADPPLPLSLSQPALKRRKLSRVPAGAADWDVPFPFPPGEGPPNYKEEWTNERCERLISDFITLLREGANKAVARASTKRASSQPAPQSSSSSHPTSARRSLPPADGNHRSPSSNYVPLPLDVYLQPTVPCGYATLPLTPAIPQSLELGMDQLAAAFGIVVPPPGDNLSNPEAFGLSMNPLPPEFDLDPLLLNLMGTGPSQEGPSGIGSPVPFSEEPSTPALSYSPCPSQSITSGPSPMTPNFDSSFPAYSPSGLVVGQQDRVVSFEPAPDLEPQDGAYFSQGTSLYQDLIRRGLFTELELGMDIDDFSRVFGMETDTPCERSVANQPPHLCDPSSVELPIFPGLELLSQGPGAGGEGLLSVNTRAPNTPLPSSMLSQAASDIPSLFAPQQNPIPSYSTSSVQRQKPVPKRSTRPVPPSKTKGTVTLAAAKKRREDAIQQARDLRRELLVGIGKSKVELWELTMEQGVLTRMSKDERLAKS